MICFKIISYIQLQGFDILSERDNDTDNVTNTPDTNVLNQENQEYYNWQDQQYLNGRAQER